MFDWLVHFIFWCIHLALEIRYRAGLYWKNLIEITMGMYYKEPTPRELKRKTENFQKLPKHMGFILDSTQIDYKKIAKIILWSAALGIHFLTIFDGQGNFSKIQLTNIYLSTTNSLTCQNNTWISAINYYEVIFIISLCRNIEDQPRKIEHCGGCGEQVLLWRDECLLQH